MRKTLQTIVMVVVTFGALSAFWAGGAAALAGETDYQTQRNGDVYESESYFDVEYFSAENKIVHFLLAPPRWLYATWYGLLTGFVLLVFWVVLALVTFIDSGEEFSMKPAAERFWKTIFWIQSSYWFLLTIWVLFQWISGEGLPFGTHTGLIECGDPRGC